MRFSNLKVQNLVLKMWKVNRPTAVYSSAYGMYLSYLKSYVTKWDLKVLFFFIVMDWNFSKVLDKNIKNWSFGNYCNFAKLADERLINDHKLLRPNKVVNFPADQFCNRFCLVKLQTNRMRIHYAIKSIIIIPSRVLTVLRYLFW